MSRHTMAYMHTLQLPPQRIIELFAGPGGMSEGIAMLGVTKDEALGIEWDAAACATAEAAGHARLQADVSKVDPIKVATDYFGTADITGFHGSPPCQGFSQAGTGNGRKDSDALLRAIAMIEEGSTPEEAIAWLRSRVIDSKTLLTLEVLRWIGALRPGWITLEQVPAVLVLWEAMSRVLVTWGYNVVTGKLNAEQYGVPQTRTRAILIASREHPVALPTPTHSRYHNRTPGRLDPGVPRWVSMAEALGWGMKRRPSYTVMANHGRGSGVEWGGKTTRERMLAMNDAALAAPEGETDDWAARPEVDREALLAIVEPRVNNQSGTEFDLTWPADRPAPTIAGRELVTMPGANANRYNGSTKSRNDGIRATPAELGVLQSFREDYPWQGGKSKQCEQVGNAVPPLLGFAVARAAVQPSLVKRREVATAPTLFDEVEAS